MTTAKLFAGSPIRNSTLMHQTRFETGDPCGLIVLPSGERVFMVRDIEVDRARKAARADRVVVPGEFAPLGGASGDRETATAEAIAEFLQRSGVREVVCDRTLPAVYIDALLRAGLRWVFDATLGAAERRSKDDREVEAIRRCQADTEAAMRLACETIARADAARDGTLVADGSPLTAERVRGLIDTQLATRGYDNPTSIVACGEQGADCHHRGHGVLRTGQPVIVDIFPISKETFYHGDCTRTVVHGEPTPQLVRMHKAVIEAKAAAVAGLRAGASGDSVHGLTIASLARAGFKRELPPAGSPPEHTALHHGTGHGLGLDGHEPPLLDDRGPELVAGDVVTVEPGLYSRAYGGVRVEDVYLVGKDGATNLGGLHEGLDWRA